LKSTSDLNPNSFPALEVSSFLLGCPSGLVDFKEGLKKTIDWFVGMGN
jgi:hypothetical protein